MKKSILTLIIVFASSTLILKAQDTTRVKVLGKNLVTVVEGGGKGNEVKIGNNSIDIVDGRDDSVKVRVGRMANTVQISS